MSSGQQLEFTLQTRDPQPPATIDRLHALGLRLLGQLECLAQDLAALPDRDRCKIEHLAWRATQVVNDLCSAASNAAVQQRQRLAEQRRLDTTGEPYEPEPPSSRSVPAQPPTGNRRPLSHVA